MVFGGPGWWRRECGSLGGGELRWDERQQDWVIVATGRSQRPHGAGSAASCPLCPGPGQDTAAETWRLPSSDAPGWRVRAVPNWCPVLQPGNGDGAHTGAAPPRFVPYRGRGWHELVIESPRHGWDMAAADVAEIRDVLAAWRDRKRDLRVGSAYVTAFRNRGTASGTSLRHPHSQIVASPVVPSAIVRAVDTANAYYRRHRRCLESDLAAAERHSGRRVIAMRDVGTAFVPFAPETDYAIRVVPRVRRADFGGASPGELIETAELLRAALCAMATALDEPAYHLVLRTAPTGYELSPALCWSIDVFPQGTRLPESRLGTGFRVLTMTPETMAATLREAAAPAKLDRRVARVIALAGTDGAVRARRDRADREAACPQRRAVRPLTVLEQDDVPSAGAS